MLLGRLARACTPSITRLHAPYSSFASTSRSTLDDPLPPATFQTPWTDLTHSPTISHSLLERQALKKGRYRDRQRARRLHRPPEVLSTPSQATPARLRRTYTRRTPNDRTQISPHLPLHTRERNFLLDAFRQALWSRAPASPRRRRAMSRAAMTKQRAWNPDQVWMTLARVLRYPDEVPDLPRSHFPSSMRSVDAIEGFYGYDEQGARDPAHHEPTEDGFFTSSRTSPSLPLSTSPDLVRDADGRSPITLSFPELKRSFTILATSRPRTRNGLNRLLVVAELIARKKGAQLSSAAEGASEQEGSGTELRGGGVGLDEQDWTALMLFSASCLRTTRPEPDMKTALSLFSQYLARTPSPSPASPRTPSTSPSSSSPPSPSGSTSLPPRRRTQLRHLYNALLRLAVRARMYELYDVVCTRRREAGFTEEHLVGDAAYTAEELKREAQRGARLERLWEIWEGGIRRAGERDKRKELAPREKERNGRLWALWVWVLAKQGKTDEAMKVYKAMRNGREVDLASFRPADEQANLISPSSAVTPSAPYLLTPPPLTDALYTALLQPLAFYGQLPQALRILRDLILTTASLPASRPRKYATKVHAMPHHFLPLFRAFATFGARGGGSGGGVATGGLTRTLLRSYGGRHSTLGASHAVARSASPLASLTRSTLANNDLPTDNPFTYAALSALFDSFLHLRAPPSSLHPSLPFAGQRTAPHPQLLFWILFAFQKLSGGDPEVSVEVWRRLEEKFGGEEARGRGWTGWRPGGRVKKMVDGYLEKREELWKQWEELE